MKVRHASSADAAAAFLALRARRKGARAKEAKVEAVRADARRSVAMWLPTKLYAELVAHCREFGITPREYLRRCLAASKLSKGGV